MNLSAFRLHPRGILFMTGIICLLLSQRIAAQPPQVDLRLYEIANAPSPDRIEQDITTLVSFGTRSTLSDTTSDTRGIGAARRWLRSEFERISAACDNCLEVIEQRGTGFCRRQCTISQRHLGSQ